MSNYILYTDKPEKFKCDIRLQGANISNATARIVLETKNLNLFFNGRIDEYGKCTIPIKELRGLLGENIKGKMALEVFADDTYFIPWHSKFIVERSKKVAIDVRENLKIQNPTVKVSVDTKESLVKPVKELTKEFLRCGIRGNNISKSSGLVEEVSNNYFESNSHYRKRRNEIITKSIRLVLNSKT